MSRQWVVARRPSRTPAAASANAPVQIEAMRAPRCCAARRAARTGAGGTRRWGVKPGTRTVSALASASSPAWATIGNPVVVGTGPGSAAQTVTRYGVSS